MSVHTIAKDWDNLLLKKGLMQLGYKLSFLWYERMIVRIFPIIPKRFGGLNFTFLESEHTETELMSGPTKVEFLYQG